MTSWHALLHVLKNTFFKSNSFKKNFSLFIWLHPVLVAAGGIFVAVCGIFSCGMRTLSCGMWDLVP